MVSDGFSKNLDSSRTRSYPANGVDSSVSQTTYGDRARFYDVEYALIDDQAFLKSLVTDNVRSILEVPCGAGRNMQWLAKTGREVTLADIEPAMIVRVKERLEASASVFQDTVSATVADMRNLTLDKEFDLILVPKEALQLLANREQVAAALASMKEHLSQDGLLMVDLCTFDKDRLGRKYMYPGYFDPESEDGVLALDWTKSLSSGEKLSRARVQNRNNTKISIEYRYTLSGCGRAPRAWSSEITLLKLNLANLKEIAWSSDLECVAAFCDYQRTPYVDGDGRAIALLSKCGRK